MCILVFVASKSLFIFWILFIIVGAMPIKYRAISYNELAGACKKIAEDVVDRYGEPECIIYIERGSMMPARMPERLSGL